MVVYLNSRLESNKEEEEHRRGSLFTIHDDRHLSGKGRGEGIRATVVSTLRRAVVVSTARATAAARAEPSTIIVTSVRATVVSTVRGAASPAGRARLYLVIADVTV